MPYDENYGNWDMGDNDEDRAEIMGFYQRTKRTNVTKRCERCNRIVEIQPDYAICNSCADLIESAIYS